MAQSLIAHGWTDVRPLRGGFDAWRRMGYPTEPKTSAKLTLAEVAKNVRDAEGHDNA